MPRLEIYRAALYSAFALVLMFILTSPGFAQEPGEAAGNTGDPAAEPPSRSLVWTGTGEGSLNQTFPEAAAWLTLDEGDRVLGLFYPQAGPQARGAVLVLADEGETAASGVTGPLAAGLASRGWAVLTLGLESPAPILHQVLMRPAVMRSAAATDAEQQSTSGSVMIDVMSPEDTDDLEARFRNRIGQTLQAGQALLVERGYEAPAVVGVGRASIHVINRLLEGADASALIWVAPWFYPTDRTDLPERLESLSTPLLELYPSGSDTGQDSWSMGMWLRRAGISGFERQPVPWFSSATGVAGDVVASRIAAWLESRQR